MLNDLDTDGHVHMVDAIDALLGSVPRVNGCTPVIEWSYDVIGKLDGRLTLHVSWVGIVELKIPMTGVLINDEHYIPFIMVEPSILHACEWHLEKYGCIEVE